MKTLFIALLLTGAAAVSAHAETFTGTSTSTITGRNTFAVPGEKPVGSISVSFSGNTVWASGTTTAIKGTCGGQTTPPGSIFETTLVCNYTDANGDTASILAGCDFTNKEMTEQNCWGGMFASAGPHSGKSGTISWHLKAASDGKSGMSKSVGQWND